MNWELMAQFAGVGFSFLLIGRLLLLHLHKVYRIFCAFLLADVSGSLFWFIEHYLYPAGSHRQPPIDYRVGWLYGKMAVWVFTIWTVYALLGAILKNLHGIRRFSRKVINFSFAVAVVFGLLSAIPEYWASALSPQCAS